VSLQSIGMNISKLRKSKGVTQEELANFLGVSAQAVSKWECGGTPDTELLPRIADYFGVSIDSLFGRNANEFIDIEAETAKHIASFEQEQRIAVAFNHCWTVQKSLFGAIEQEERETLDAINSKLNNDYIHSQSLFNSGITLMSLAENLQYFMIMPQPKAGWTKGLFDISDYQKLFQTLADPAVLNCLFFLYKRENKPFTSKLFEKEFSMSPEKADEVLNLLEQYSFVKFSYVEIDDAIQKIYNFHPNPAFIAMLAIAKEIIRKPNSFIYYSGCRAMPYLEK